MFWLNVSLVTGYQSVYTPQLWEPRPHKIKKLLKAMHHFLGHVKDSGCLE